MKKYDILRNAELNFIRENNLKPNITHDGFRNYTKADYHSLALHLINVSKKLRMGNSFYSFQEYDNDQPDFPYRFKINPDQSN